MQLFVCGHGHCNVPGKSSRAHSAWTTFRGGRSAISAELGVLMRRSICDCEGEPPKSLKANLLTFWKVKTKSADVSFGPLPQTATFLWLFRASEAPQLFAKAALRARQFRLGDGALTPAERSAAEELQRPASCGAQPLGPRMRCEIQGENSIFLLQKYCFWRLRFSWYERLSNEQWATVVWHGAVINP